MTGGTQKECRVELYGAATAVVEPAQLTVRYHLERFYYAPIKAGDLVGRVDYLYKGEVVTSQQLMASEDVGKQEESLQKKSGFSGLLHSLIRAFSAIIEFFQSFGQK